MNAPSEIFSQDKNYQGKETYSSDEHSSGSILVSLCHCGTIPPLERRGRWETIAEPKPGESRLIKVNQGKKIKINKLVSNWRTT
jgi:hypothetical protein